MADLEQSELNERQKEYLKFIFHLDQLEEQANRAAWNKGHRVAKASEYRWIEYFPSRSTPSALYRYLSSSKLVDSGTGATFNALWKRNLIEYKQGDSEGVFFVKLTVKGRKVARELTGVQPEKKLPVGTLRDYHWKALVAAYHAEPNGLQWDGAGKYGPFKWQTVWLRLRDYKRSGKAYPLVDDTGGTLHITEQGKEFYLANLEHYQKLYPEIETDSPTSPSSTGN